MRVARLVLTSALVLSFHWPAAAGTACADGVLRLNEVLAGPATDWDGSGAFSSRDDEWIEVTNTGTSPLGLGGFILSDGDSIPRFALSGTLAAGAQLVIFGRQSYDWERTNGFPAFGFSLNNSGDSVLLWQVVGADTLLVDHYAFRSHEAAADRAIGRTTDTGAWQLFDQRNPYTGTTPPQGNGCAPTPGSPNACNSTPVQSATWGRLKTTYR